MGAVGSLWKSLVDTGSSTLVLKGGRQVCDPLNVCRLGLSRDVQEQLAAAVEKRGAFAELLTADFSKAAALTQAKIAVALTALAYSLRNGSVSGFSDAQIQAIKRTPDLKFRTLERLLNFWFSKTESDAFVVDSYSKDEIDATIQTFGSPLQRSIARVSVFLHSSKKIDLEPLEFLLKSQRSNDQAMVARSLKAYGIAQPKNFIAIINGISDLESAVSLLRIAVLMKWRIDIAQLNKRVVNYIAEDRAKLSSREDWNFFKRSCQGYLKGGAETLVPLTGNPREFKITPVVVPAAPNHPSCLSRNEDRSYDPRTNARRVHLPEDWSPVYEQRLPYVTTNRPDAESLYPSLDAYLRQGFAFRVGLACREGLYPEIDEGTRGLGWRQVSDFLGF